MNQGIFVRSCYRNELEHWMIEHSWDNCFWRFFFCKMIVFANSLACFEGDCLTWGLWDSTLFLICLKWKMCTAHNLFLSDLFGRKQCTTKLISSNKVKAPYMNLQKNSFFNRFVNAVPCFFLAVISIFAWLITIDHICLCTRYKHV